MQLLETGRDIHAKGGDQASKYRIAQSAKVMNMFSNMLYKDKIAAPIRELATNAWDAHIKAGNTEQVPDVMLPTLSHPEFTIRDYGTGLSPEAIDSIYRTYGESDKTHSNDFTGCMGIGSKSPFCYSDSFTTTSYYNGMKYIYINSKNAMGEPQLQLFHSEPTTEPNGLQVSFAVRPDDFYKFLERATNILQWFPKPFNVTPNLTYPAKEYFLEGNGWKVRKGSGSGESCVVMGNVRYPIELKHFSTDATSSVRDNDWYQYYDKSEYITLLKMGVELHMPIGDVEMDISREGLQYTPATIAAIKAQLDVILKELYAQIESRFVNCKTLWEARVLYDELLKSNLKEFKDILGLTKVKWNNQEITLITNIKKIVGLEVISFYQDTSWRGRNTIKRNDQVQVINVDKNAVFYLNDIRRGAYTLCKNIATEKYNVADGAAAGPVYLLKCDDPKLIEDFANTLGFDKSMIVLCSTLPKPPRKSGGTLHRDNVFTFNSNSVHRSSKDYWTAAEIDLDDGGMYVEIKHFEPQGVNQSCYRIKEIIDHLRALGITVPELVGIKTVAVKRYNKHDDWENFFDWAKQQVETYLASHDLADTLEKLKEFQANNSCKYKNFCDNKGEVESNPTLVDLRLILSRWSELETIHNDAAAKTEAIRSLCGFFNITVTPATVQQDYIKLDKLCTDFEKKYPLLRTVSQYDLSSYYDNNRKMWLNYISLVYSSKGTNIYE